MVEVSKPMGSYHIIDGEKVSVKYRGQARTCARCHLTESVCPGRAIAKDCNSERVLLSAHMEEHWVNVGYKPDTNALNEVDELDVQVGMKEPESTPVQSLRPDHSEKYSSVVISGFSKTAEERDIFDILLEGGLPAEYRIEDVKKNDRNGSLTIENISSSVCISLSNHIHGKIFFKRKVYVNSVVQKTPTKETLETDQEEALVEGHNSLEGSESDSSSDSDDEPTKSASKPPSTKLFTSISEKGKRAAADSPELCSETKKEKKKKKKKVEPAQASVRSSSRQGGVKPTSKN